MRRRQANDFPAGMTLVEIMVVVVLIAIAAAMVVPQLTGTADMRAQSAARTLMADLEYAQNHAIVTQADVSVQFNAGGNNYSVSNGSGTLEHPITKKAYVMDFDEASGLTGVSITSVSFDGGSEVTFSALGAPACAGGAPLAGGQVDVSADEHTYRVSVAPVTGRVSVTKVP